jgi:hypothetical protein
VDISYLPFYNKRLWIPGFWFRGSGELVRVSGSFERNPKLKPLVKFTRINPDYKIRAKDVGEVRLDSAKK